MDKKELKELVELFETSSLSSLEFQQDNQKIKLKRHIHVDSTSPVEIGSSSIDEAFVSTIKSPMVGTFYQSPSEDGEPLDETCYLVCNHQSAFDPIMVVASYPLALSFVSKKENAKIPIIGRWSKLMRVIFFDRNSRKDNIRMLREVSRLLKEEIFVLIFPEGTRSKSKTLNPFKAGALQPATLANVPIVPVTLVMPMCLIIKPLNMKKRLRSSMDRKYTQRFLSVSLIKN